MTHPQHHAVAGPAGSVILYPRRTNMWAVAWRQHRVQLAALVAVMAVAAAALIWLRFRILSPFQEFGCELFPAVPTDCLDADGANVWWAYGLSSLSVLAHLGMLGGPVVLGVFAAAPIFTREFGRGTQVFALTQSVTARRWFVTKVLILAVPLVVGLLALGQLMQWVDLSISITAGNAMMVDQFLSRGFIPATVGLMAFTLAIAVGMIARSTLTALIVSALIGFPVLVGIGMVQPHILPADRIVAPIALSYPQLSQAEYDAIMSGTAQWPGTLERGPDDAWVSSGYLDANGMEVLQLPGMMTSCYDSASQATDAVRLQATTGPNAITEDEFYNSPAYQNTQNAAVLDCLTELGVTAAYTDILPVRLLWPLRAAIGGILVLLSALFFATGLGLLPRAASKR